MLAGSLGHPILLLGAHEYIVSKMPSIINKTNNFFIEKKD